MIAAANQNNVNQLTLSVVEIVNNESSITFDELANQYPEFAVISTYELWYEVNNLAEDGRVRIENRNGTIILHSVEI